MLINSISICNKYSLYNGDGNWKVVVQAIAPTVLTRRITKATTTASVRIHEANTKFGTMADGARGIVTMIMMTTKVATETVIDMAIGIPEVDTVLRKINSKFNFRRVFHHI